MATPDRVEAVKRWRIGVVFLAAGLSVALTLALGQWQLRRAQQKATLQTQWDAALRWAPMALASSDVNVIESRLPLRLRLSGDWLHAHEVWLDNRMQNGRAGFHLLTPLRLPDGAVVLVNRGFAPRDAADRLRLPAVARPVSRVAIEGVAVARAARVLDLGGDAAPTGPRPWVWQNLERETFERATGLAVPGWIVLQQGGDADGLDRQWPRLSAGVDQHRGYAIQWFALAGLIVLLTLFLSIRTLRRGRQATTQA